MFKGNGGLGASYRIYTRKGKDLLLDGVFKYDVFLDEESAIHAMIDRGDVTIPYVVIKEYSVLKNNTEN